MKKRKVTIRDVAAAAGVSLMTVSRAIHGRPGVGEELQRKIATLAAEMGYVPNRIAGQLGQQKSPMTVGVVIPHLANTIFPDILQSIETVLSANGYRILLCCSYNNPIKEFQDVSALLERQSDGIIWCPVLLDESRRAAELIRSQHCPLVFLDRRLPEFPADAALVDDFNGMLSAVRHLTGQGISRIAYLGPRLESYVARERRSGFLAALAEAGVPAREEWMLRIGSDIASGRSGAARLLEAGEVPEAVCCFNDPLAIGVEQELLERGVPVPEQVALTGFSGTVESEIAQVPVTSVFQDAPGLGTAAAELLLNRMINPEVKLTPVERVLKTHLIVRASSLAKRAKQAAEE